MTTSKLAAPSADFPSLVAPHWEVLVRVAGRLAAPGSRDDVLQDVLTLAWRRRASYDSDRRLVWDWLGSTWTDAQGYGQFPTVTVY